MSRVLILCCFLSCFSIILIILECKKKTATDCLMHEVKRGEEIGIMTESAAIHTTSHSATILDRERHTSTKQFSGTMAQE